MARQLSTEALVEFVTVARHLNFARAAGDLRLHPSVLSRRIRRLEDRLGVRLLDRDTRSVALTEAGSALLARALDVLDRINDAEAEVSRFASEPEGTLRLSVPNLFGQIRIAPHLPEFMRRYPKLRLEISFQDGFVDLIVHRFDAAVRIGALEDGNDLRVRRLAENRRVICASPSYLARYGTPTHPSDLQHHRTLHFTPLLSGTSWRLKGSGGEIDVHVNPILATDNIVALLHAALAGEGIAILGTFIAEADLESGRLVPILEPYHPAESVVSIVYPNAPHVPRKVHAVIEFLSQLFAGDP
ncbi:LysR family transcriptional regulator [Azomonas macrocytogenes]|uniref:DNA-binding transcriptional LysR family regulator n=1 Tax=Azomonas macrocytogenes TaxID=69962 RepID=A0A839T4C1_AZOMA|nr:LysR family transcriptional regulator [Azomonas macrocytogenes]MBB3104387.1 DNA-binding transcriptional LysR family regulator [Azomonas macrocytogenes]